MYLLDTNTLIYFFKGMGNVAHRLLHTAPSEIGIPSIVIFELEVGIAKSTNPHKRRQQLQEITAVVHIIPFGEKEAQKTAQIRVQLEKKGLPIGPYDLLIAGITLTHHAILVTHNTQEFERIDTLAIEDWY